MHERLALGIKLTSLCCDYLLNLADGVFYKESFLAFQPAALESRFLEILLQPVPANVASDVLKSGLF